MLMFIVATTVAVDKYWAGPGGGNCGTAGNWTPAGAPVAADNAVLTYGAYPVMITAPATANYVEGPGWFYPAASKLTAA